MLDLKVIDNDVEHKRVQKVKAEKVKTALTKLQNQAQVGKDRISDLDEGQVDGIVEQMQNLLQVQQQRQQLVSIRSNCKMEHGLGLKSIANLGENLEIYDESDVELQRMYDLHHTYVHRHDADENKLDTEKRSIMRKYLNYNVGLMMHRKTSTPS